jgi:hypothetical protein
VELAKLKTGFIDFSLAVDIVDEYLPRTSRFGL